MTNRTTNLAKSFIRSTKPALLQNPCYAFALFFRPVCQCVGLVALLHFCLAFVRLEKCKCATKSVGLCFFFVIYFVVFSSVFVNTLFYHFSVSVNIDMEIFVKFEYAFKDSCLFFYCLYRYFKFVR